MECDVRIKDIIVNKIIYLEEINIAIFCPNQIEINIWNWICGFFYYVTTSLFHCVSYYTNFHNIYKWKSANIDLFIKTPCMSFGFDDPYLGIKLSWIK